MMKKESKKEKATTVGGFPVVNQIECPKSEDVLNIFDETEEIASFHSKVSDGDELYFYDVYLHKCCMEFYHLAFNYDGQYFGLYDVLFGSVNPILDSLPFYLPYKEGLAELIRQSIDEDQSRSDGKDDFDLDEYLKSCA